ncbi:MAG: ribulose-phosphate 3-epimerase, partial [Oscillospiraceae bacterium]|nr:ribulose-phosphate 3-epimerase [Oscillospiraceae bacterium]
DYITVHAESEYTETDIRTMLGLIKSTGCKAGLAINPPTPADAVFPYVDVADMIVVMSVNPGYGGQSFIHGSIDKIAAIRKHADSLGVNPLIEVDGGINAQTAPNAVKAGADILVAGTYLFGAPDMREAADSLMRL